MILVIGGAYSGKLEFVKENYGVDNGDIFYCQDGNIDFSKKVISGLHKFTYENSLHGKNSLEVIEENLELLKDKIIICDEISSGIVPLKKEERVWREDTGKCLQRLSKEAEKVYRVFCGIPTVLKK
ncbi:MAG: bifunctional adenosylcobinamide kinase/adenosylcobinamide-phosphate guanylyltransferase [Clostridium sp.]|uniref:bifunctional adenosylcobinamide kinase/adenosylcobinamide-phosphate guanylyltransferase n=1 Tax=Clostridium culturomicium TaxID=1499683 RepID=UPI00058DA8F5|nr:bifunctional adenosylcobinamide kinase/adenosylcobinamide-phosphate guanylyltransferase [Clostridium culturomicium]MDU4889656.1 bifunctional adenosylcobinamide kinase/adenosylcobinamide-phosphate guanylyltransferase [Clostridium sp.]MDU7082700.1 bifunctional adenosylcobinamide kinase/adenosylcobinamide-phosphate guanylyltransferase [Clostridium sp.]